LTNENRVTIRNKTLGKTVKLAHHVKEEGCYLESSVIWSKKTKVNPFGEKVNNYKDGRVTLRGR